MSYSDSISGEETHQATICEFIDKCSGLELKASDPKSLSIHQRADGKVLAFAWESVGEVITRLDSQGQTFLQVNFNNGRKILLTEKLIGFKPVEGEGIDLKKLPKVVTTPDLVSVVEAIEESMSSGPEHWDELDLLRRVFDSVIAGGEAVGFDLTIERDWLSYIVSTPQKPSA